MVPFLRDVKDRTAFEVVEMNGGIENFAKILGSPEENCKQSKYYEFYEIEKVLWILWNKITNLEYLGLELR